MSMQKLGMLLTENISELDSLSNEDWQNLARAAQAQGVAPLAYWILSASGKISALPSPAQHILRGAYSQTWKHNQDIFSELEILTREFNRANIPVVVLKGACFALTIYPDSGARPMGDLDLLVPAKKLTEALEIAKALGYKDDTPEASPGLNDLLGHAVCLQKKGTALVTLEIHQSLIAEKTFTYAVPVDWFWEQTEKMNNPRFTNLLILTPAAQTLYAATHAMLQHGGRMAPLRWFVDIDRIVRFYNERMDWDVLLAQAKVFEWSSALDAALTQTQKYFSTPIPDSVLTELSQRSDRHQEMVAYLKKKPITHTQEEYQKLIMLNAYGKIRLLAALIIPSPAYMRWRYELNTAWALPVYYPLRWWGILKDGVQTLAALIWKKTSI